jgi:CRISPR-associated protein Csb2
MAFTQALRGTLLSQISESGKSFISGHAADGAPLEVPHLAYVPLAFVDAPYADGHLLGLGLALPKDTTAAQESALWQALDAVADPDTGEITLVAGSAGSITVQVDDRPAPPRALRPATWCGASTCWATVTPIVIDRFPRKRAITTEGFPEGLTVAQIAKRKQAAQRAEMDDFFIENIREACRRQGLPEPLDIALSGTSFLIGAPPSVAFDPLMRKDGTRRWHLHARLTFSRPVAGPLLLGAGRYRGYGLCRPILGSHHQESDQ